LSRMTGKRTGTILTACLASGGVQFSSQESYPETRFVLELRHTLKLFCQKGARSAPMRTPVLRNEPLSPNVGSCCVSGSFQLATS
jgi:hypothetical protein